MIITKLNGGLGNQLFQYAVAKAISIKNNDNLKLDITVYETYKLHNGFRLNIFNIDENIASNEEIEKLKGKSNKFYKLLRKLKVYIVSTCYKEKERTIYDENIFNHKDIYLDGYWQNEKYFLDIRDILLKELTPKKDISKEAKSYLSRIQNAESVSLHVRRGDYLNHPEIGVLDISYYQNAYNYIVKNVENPIFYIFSNDLLWCEEKFAFIKDKAFITETKTEIDDMILMKNCKHNIVANSSFSWWGAWLNENDGAITIAPKRWMVENPKNHKWSSNKWLEI